MTGPVVLLVLGWLPLWAVALVRRQKLRAGRLLLGGALVGFVGGMCCVELRRYGLLAGLSPEGTAPPFGLHLHEVVRFALLGSAGALAGEILMDRLPAEPRRKENSPPSAESDLR